MGPPCFRVERATDHIFYFSRARNLAAKFGLELRMDGGAVLPKFQSKVNTRSQEYKVRTHTASFDTMGMLEY